MPSIKPTGGWEITPPPTQTGVNLPLYTYDPSQHSPSRGSLINDLSAMGGKKAGQLTFGTVFGATSAFYLARLLMTLLKIGIVVALIGTLL